MVAKKFILKGLIYTFFGFRTLFCRILIFRNINITD